MISYLPIITAFIVVWEDGRMEGGRGGEGGEGGTEEGT